MKKESVKNKKSVVKHAKSASVAQDKTSKKVVTKNVAVVKDSVPAVITLKTVTTTKTVGNATPIVKKHTLYAEVTPDKYFVLCDGRKIKSVKELADTLQLINDDMFKYHATDTKNDFANWINDVFGEPDVAKKIKSSRNRLDASIDLYREMFDRLNKSKK